MRYVAPARDAVDPAVFGRSPLAGWNEYADLLRGPDWPALLADGRHYEQRIAETGVIATRERNWHDLFNALVWLRHAPLKRALNVQQVAEIARAGAKSRS